MFCVHSVYFVWHQSILICALSLSFCRSLSLAQKWTLNSLPIDNNCEVWIGLNIVNLVYTHFLIIIYFIFCNEMIALTRASEKAPYHFSTFSVPRCRCECAVYVYNAAHLPLMIEHKHLMGCSRKFSLLFFYSSISLVLFCVYIVWER